MTAAQSGTPAHRRRERVRALIVTLTADGRPRATRELAARAGMRPADLIATLKELEALPHPEPGPLFVDGGWVWVA